MDNSTKRHRIVKITYGDKTEEFEVQTNTGLFGAWINMFDCRFSTLAIAEQAYARTSVKPMMTLVKELP